MLLTAIGKGALVFGKMWRAPLMRLLIAWHVGWGAVALFTDASPLIDFLNLLILPAALGVVVAFAPMVIEALTSPVLRKGDILSLGIWLSWVSIIEQRTWSITWVLMGRPAWWVTTDFSTHFFALTLLASILHLAGPEAIEGRVPTRQWIRIGVMVGAGSLACGLLLWSIRLSLELMFRD